MTQSKLSPAHLKWIVIAFLGVTFMVIFKDDLSKKIKEPGEVNIGPKGISITTKTISTPLGQTIISGPPTIETAGITKDTPPNYQSPRGYLINWPQDGSWQSRPDMAQMLNLDMVIAYNRSWGEYVPNVNVTIEPSTTSYIRQWLESSNQMLPLMGFNVISEKIDIPSKSAVRIVHGNFFGLEADAIQRVILNQGRAYIVTATRPRNFNADPKLWQDLNNILNSFRVN